jgi:predicted lipid-binding transport protein (Tim44 family)
LNEGLPFLYIGRIQHVARVRDEATKSSSSEMSPVFDPLNLILLAIAIIVFWRLKSVLGQRTGTERPPADVTVLKPRRERRLPVEPPPDIASGPATEESKPSAPVWAGFAEKGSATAKGLDAIAKASVTFDAAQFLEGAKAAYEMILSAFAGGDKAALKPLLAREVNDSFAAAMDRRAKNGSSLVFQFVGVKSAKIERAELANRTASITVRFVSDMIHGLIDKSGQLVEGDAKAVRSVEDVWTFERDVASRDPNWKLVATEDAIG